MPCHAMPCQPRTVLYKKSLQLNVLYINSVQLNGQCNGAHLVKDQFWICTVFEHNSCWQSHSALKTYGGKVILDQLAIPLDFLFHIVIIQIFQSATMILCKKVVTASQKMELLIV